MKKTPISNEKEIIDVDPLHEKVTDFIEMHGKNLLYGVLCVLVLIVGFQWYFSSSGRRDLRDYHKADQLFTKLVQNPMDETTYNQLVQLTSTHPELKAKYQVELIEVDSVKRRSKEMQEEVNALFRRLGSSLTSIHKSFVETSVVLSQANETDFQKAQQQVQALEEGFEKEREQSLLRGYNLLRLAFIQMRLGDAGGGKQTFEQFKKEIDEPQRKQLESLFQIGQTNLEQFYTDRN